MNEGLRAREGDPSGALGRAAPNTPDHLENA